jgi:hypothetical protein
MSMICQNEERSGVGYEFCVIKQILSGKPLVAEKYNGSSLSSITSMNRVGSECDQPRKKVSEKSAAPHPGI